MSMIQNVSEISPHARTGIQIIKPAFFKLNKSNADKDDLFKSYQHDENIKLSVSKLSEEQVKSSQMYNRLLSRITEMEASKEKFNGVYAKKLKIVEEGIDKNKQTIQKTKFNVWETKNQIMALQQELADLMNEAHEIEEWLEGDEADQQEDNQLFDQREEGQQQQEEQMESDQDFNSSCGVSNRQILDSVQPSYSSA